MDATIQRTYSEFPDTMNTNFEDVEYAIGVLYSPTEYRVLYIHGLLYRYTSAVLLVLYVVESEFGYY